MPRAILYSVDVHHNTTRHWDVPRPLLALIYAGFPGLGADKIRVTPSCTIKDFDLLEIWRDALRTWPQQTIETFSGNDPDVVPPAFEQAFMLAEAEAEKLDANRRATPHSPEAKAEIDAKALQEAQAEIDENPEATPTLPKGKTRAKPAPVPPAFE